MPPYIKIIISVALSIAAILLFLIYKTESQKKCMLGMLLSSVGDFFMVNIFSLGEFSTYIGASFFIAAHIVYGCLFIDSEKEKGFRYFSRGFYLGLTVMVISVIGLGINEYTASERKPILFHLILVYIAAIGFNLCSQYSYALSKRGLSLILPFGVTAFYISDMMVFLNLLNINNGLRQYVWFIYPFAQLAVILFNSDLKKRLPAYQS